MDEKMLELNNEDLDEVVGGASSGTKKATIVKCDVANIRDAAGNGSVIGSVRCGRTVTFHKWATKEWAKITYNGINGYIYKDYISVK